MMAAAAFWEDPHDREKHTRFVHAFFTTSIVASDGVMKAFNPEPNADGMYKLSKKLSTVTPDTSQFTDQRKLLGDIIEEVNRAMRKDVNRFSKHR